MKIQLGEKKSKNHQVILDVKLEATTGLNCVLCLRVVLYVCEGGRKCQYSYNRWLYIQIHVLLFPGIMIDSLSQTLHWVDGVIAV